MKLRFRLVWLASALSLTCFGDTYELGRRSNIAGINTKYTKKRVGERSMSNYSTAVITCHPQSTHYPSKCLGTNSGPSTMKKTFGRCRPWGYSSAHNTGFSTASLCRFGVTKTS